MASLSSNFADVVPLLQRFILSAAEACYGIDLGVIQNLQKSYAEDGESWMLPVKLSVAILALNRGRTFGGGSALAFPVVQGFPVAACCALSRSTGAVQTTGLYQA